MADEVPQPAPACGPRTVHRRADAGRAEPEQRLARVAVVARYEGDGRDSGKLAYEPGHRRELVAAAGVDREDERVHPLPPGRPQRVPARAGVDGRKTAVARRIGAGAARRGGDRTAGPDARGAAARLPASARAIAAREPQARVEFVGFDLEELQTVTGRYRVGSRALARAKRARREALGGALILEMVGYRDPRPGTQIVPPFLGIDVPRTGDFLAAVGDTRSRDLLEGFVSAARAAAPDLPLVPYATRLRGWLLPLTRLSDNASSWDARYPALMLTDPAFLRHPHYRGSTDTSATLDYAFMAAVTEATAGALAQLADAS